MKFIKSTWFYLVLAIVAASVFALLQSNTEAQEIQTCHHCIETRIIIEHSAVHCLELPETIEYYRNRKFSRFQIETREDVNTLETICEIIAVK